MMPCNVVVLNQWLLETRLSSSLRQIVCGLDVVSIGHTQLLLIQCSAYQLALASCQTYRIKKQP